MIRHIVEFRLAADDPDQRALDAGGIHKRLTALVGVVPTVRSIEVAADLGLVGGHWDVVLVSDHDSNADLESYQSHPAHRAAADWISTVVSDRATVDYER
ncbi:MAG: Dabb family protein [Actinomycetota bacterium]|nr:Dabb family protein [Actinomycetota bacterium]